MEGGFSCTAVILIKAAVWETWRVLREEGELICMLYLQAGEVYPEAPEEGPGEALRRLCPDRGP